MWAGWWPTKWRLSLDPTNAPFAAGMSATAIITTAEVDNVLLVPNRYIQMDRESGRAFVQKMVGDVPALQEIDMGLRNDRFTQVLAGLSDGDSIALIRTSSEDQLRGVLFWGQLERQKAKREGKVVRHLPLATLCLTIHEREN